MAAKVFVGHPACRDPDWIRVSVGFSMDVFKAGIIMRMFPQILHPIVAWFTPSRSKAMENLRTAERTLGPLIDKRRAAVAAKARGEEAEVEDILLHWMMGHDTEKENKADHMALRNLFITLAAVHTTSMSASHMLFHLCAHSEWFDVMREEITEVERELGPLSSSLAASPKNWLARLEKMDSLFVESQRMNLPSLSSLGSLASGYGSQACPGRWFSVGEVKLILVKLLSEYEVNFISGRTTRPENLYVGENSFPGPSVKVLITPRERLL
ncbi:hypothetical protein BBP40_009799 [Aspergillus hancockii]|nr:hypothetical protein BBP40_009799 [Aspergillus hancockii]